MMIDLILFRLHNFQNLALMFLY